jgi:uncharacterized protein (TIGR03382 family)
MKLVGCAVTASLVGLVAPAGARPVDLMVPEHVEATVAPQANSNVIYMNRCAGGGCTVTLGNTDSRTDHSSVPNVGQGHLNAFSQGDAVWTNVMACVREVFSPFNVSITDVDPGSAPHFEIMVAGTAAAFGLPSNVGGVSPFDCSQPYIPNSLVFVFDVWGANVNEICATAAQEIAHSFKLDHCTDPSDPMTYFSFSGRRHFKDAQVQCGSDCVNGKSPFNATCTGTNLQNHVCACTTSQTQNDVQAIKTLFGEGGETPPTVTITAPKAGAMVTAGFPVVTMITDDISVSKAELRVDGVLVQTLTTGPFAFNAPTSLGNGAHSVEVTGYDNAMTPGKATVSVTIGPPCSTAADCSTGQTCIGGRCVAGPGSPGGLGASCMSPVDCQSGQCADDAGTKFCVEPCKPGQCPASFGCRDDGTGGGFCWPGFDEGGIGCSTGGSPVGPIALGLAFAALVFRRRSR